MIVPVIPRPVPLGLVSAPVPLVPVPPRAISITVPVRRSGDDGSPVRGAIPRIPRVSRVPGTTVVPGIAVVAGVAVVAAPVPAIGDRHVPDLVRNRRELDREERSVIGIGLVPGSLVAVVPRVVYAIEILVEVRRVIDAGARD